jgi:hypothetical protein
MRIAKARKAGLLITLIPALGLAAVCDEKKLPEYLKPGFSCTIRTRTFSNFAAGTSRLKVGDIDVKPIDTDVAAGFEFSGPFTLQEDADVQNSIGLSLSFLVSNGQNIEGSRVEITGIVNNGENGIRETGLFSILGYSTYNRGATGRDDDEDSIEARILIGTGKNVKSKGADSVFSGVPKLFVRRQTGFRIMGVRGNSIKSLRLTFTPNQWSR